EPGRVGRPGSGAHARRVRGETEAGEGAAAGAWTGIPAPGRVDPEPGACVAQGDRGAARTSVSMRDARPQASARCAGISGLHRASALRAPAALSALSYRNVATAREAGAGAGSR